MMNKNVATSYTSPSCNYNIFVTREELQRLLDTGHDILFVPGKCHHNRYRNGEKVNPEYHHLEVCYDSNIEASTTNCYVQFVTIGLVPEDVEL